MTGLTWTNFLLSCQSCEYADSIHDSQGLIRTDHCSYYISSLLQPNTPITSPVWTDMLNALRCAQVYSQYLKTDRKYNNKWKSMTSLLHDILHLHCLWGKMSQSWDIVSITCLELYMFLSKSRSSKGVGNLMQTSDLSQRVWKSFPKFCCFLYKTKRIWMTIH